MQYSRVLTIAGSDSGGGAGIQADIKAISATGSYAASAITAVTVQNTLGVEAVHPVPVDIIAALPQLPLTVLLLRLRPPGSPTSFSTPSWCPRQGTV